MKKIKHYVIEFILTTSILIPSLPAHSGLPIVFKEKKTTAQIIPIQYEKDKVKLLFEAYKDNYFLFASSRDDAKFQISFKYKLFTSHSKNRSILGVELPGQKPFWEKLYFGYTQKSVWDWLEDSAPFEDHNFNPELFWCSDNLNCNALESSNNKDKWAWKTRHYIGFEHESNGQNDPASRSWNRLYYRFIYWRGAYAIAPKIWTVTSESKIGSGDFLSQYIGYFDLELFARHRDEIAYGATFRHAEKGWSIVADFSIPNRKVFSGSEFNPYWYIQWFSGYAENLLKYNEKRRELRFGLRFTL